MDSLYQALSCYKTKKFEKCVDICSDILKKNAFDKATWILKMRALTESVYVDDIENEEDTIADEFLDNNIIADAARMGTSLKNSNSGTNGRPKTEVGHFVTGVVRTNLRSARARTMEQGLKSGRRVRSARPVSSHNGRYVKLGTGSMLSDNEGPFIDVSKMNLEKYAADISGKYLFEYLFYYDNNITSAMQLCLEAVKINESNDWWWTVQMGKCYYRLSLYREAEQHFKLALKLHVNIDTFLRLIRVYRKLDQPLTALDACRRASNIFPDETSFMIETARLHEALNNISTSISCYRDIIAKDASNIEAIACIGLHHFYTDQPEIALRFYKRLLQMGLVNTEVMNNMGLCCFYSQQFDVALSCFKRALALADKESAANVWYNLSHVAIGVGDLNLARNCLRLCLSIDGNHASALNNLGVLEVKRNNLSHAKSFFMNAIRQAPLLFETYFNHAKLSYQCGDLQTSYKNVQKALELSQSHIHSNELLDMLKKHLMEVH